MFTDERIVVTGGSGFMGSFLVEELLRRGAVVRVPVFKGDQGFLKNVAGIEFLDGDLRDPNFCQKLLDGADRLFHLASRRKNVAEHRRLAGEIAADNIRMSLALSASVTQKPIPVTFVSSATVPEPLSLLSVSEASETDGYALGKAASEMIWLTASRQYHFPLLTVRPVGIYGPRDLFSLEGNVIPSLMVKAKESEIIDVWGSGKAKRSFLYVEDVVRALIVLAEAEASGIQYLASPETVTVKKLAEQIRDLVAQGKELRFDDSKPEGKLALEFPLPHPSLNGMAWTPLGEGLKRTLDWYNAQR